MALAHFQRAGHKVLALVGGATAMVGDPSGRSDERNLLSTEQVKLNAEGVREQLSRFLDFDGPNAAVMVDNYDWTSRMSFIDWLRDVGKYFTVNYMVAKDSVKSRMQSEQGISYTEFSYMTMQANDFLYLFDHYGCRLQGGGSDQWGNITAGTDLIRAPAPAAGLRPDLPAHHHRQRRQVRQVRRQCRCGWIPAAPRPGSFTSTWCGRTTATWPASCAFTPSSRTRKSRNWSGRSPYKISCRDCFDSSLLSQMAITKVITIYIAYTIGSCNKKTDFPNHMDKGKGRIWLPFILKAAGKLMPFRGVAQFGEAACMGCRRSQVQVRRPDCPHFAHQCKSLQIGVSPRIYWGYLHSLSSCTALHSLSSVVCTGFCTVFSVLSNTLIFAASCKSLSVNCA